MDLWAVIAEERASILETFEALDPEQLDTPSLCGDWTVRQVLGHLVIAADPPTGRFLRELARAGGRFHTANHRLAVAEAERPMEDLVARYRERIGARNTPPGFGPQAPLSDILLHSLDARIPLGLPADRPADRYAPALELLFSSRGQRIFVPKGRPPLRWTATDLAWTHGTGDEVQGTMATLALAASGRGAAVDAVTGPGQPALAAWLRR